MKKTISMMLAGVLCMGLFAGCGNGSKAPKEVTEIVEGINKDVVEEKKTEKSNFSMTEQFQSDGKTYYVYESQGQDNDTPEPYITTLKFIYQDSQLTEVNVVCEENSGVILLAVRNYFKQKTGFKESSKNRNSSVFIKE